MKKIILPLAVLSLITAPAFAEKTGEAKVPSYKGVMNEIEKSPEAYQAKAEAGDADAQNKLGLVYDQGWGTARDPAKAVEWFRKAAEQNHAEGQFNLGRVYITQAEPNAAEGEKWLVKASEQNFTTAQVILGRLYYDGKILKQDYAEANKWYRKAADAGDPLAQISLGELYEKGHGVTQDWVQAYMWYSLGTKIIAQPDFLKAREDAASHLTPEQFAAASQAIAGWKPARDPAQ